MSDMQVANTIRGQIGNKALFLIGAKNFVATNDGLRFKVGRNKLNVNVVEVKYKPGKDLYDIIFWSIRGTSAKAKKQVDDVYAEDLTKMIGHELGLVTSFPKITTKGASGTDEAAGGICAPVGEFGPMEVIVTKKRETRDVWTCPHCENEIGEKELYYNGEQHFHRSCKKPIVLPPPTQEQLDAIQHFFRIGESQTLCMVGGCVHTGQCIKHNVVNEADTCLETGLPVNESEAYAMRDPVLPKKYMPKEKPDKPGPITVSVYLPQDGGDPEVLVAALKADKELGGAVTKNEYGEVRVSVGAATYREAEEMVRDALKRIGWVQQRDQHANMPGPYYPSAVYSESNELLYEGPLTECLKFQRVINEVTTLDVPVTSVAAIRKAQKQAAKMANGNTANQKVWRTAKKTKELVNYTDKSTDPDKRCGDCTWVQLAQHGCQKVTGQIKQDGACDLFKTGIKA